MSGGDFGYGIPRRSLCTPQGQAGGRGHFRCENKNPLLCCLVSLGYLWRGADAWARPGTRWAARYGHCTRWATKISKPSRFAYPPRFRSESRSRSRSRGVGKLPWLNLPAQKISSYRDTANFGVRCDREPPCSRVRMHGMSFVEAF